MKTPTNRGAISFRGGDIGMKKNVVQCDLCNTVIAVIEPQQIHDSFGVHLVHPKTENELALCVDCVDFIGTVASGATGGLSSG